MKGRLGKFGTIFLALALCLAGTGAAFAMWSDTVTIEGTVESGEFGVGFWEVLCVEDPESEGKDVGNITCTMMDQKGEKFDPYLGEMKPVYERILVTLNNTYPCYSVHIVHTVVNFGTVPAIVTSYDMSDPTGELNFLWITAPPASPAYGCFWKDFNGNGVFDQVTEEVINVKLVNLIGEQLEPCSEEKGEMDLHLKQPAEQGHVYHILAVITGVQWNEA